MESATTKSQAMLVHLSTLTQWFFPFGNFIFPIVIWSLKRDSRFIDNHGRQAINFQLSLLLYTLVLALVSIPIFLFTVFRHVPFRQLFDDNFHGADISAENLTGMAALAILGVVIFCFMKVAEFFLVVNASVKAAEGQPYQYPLCIPFIKAPFYAEAEVAEVDAVADADVKSEPETTAKTQSSDGVQSSSSNEQNIAP